MTVTCKATGFFASLCLREAIHCCTNCRRDLCAKHTEYYADGDEVVPVCKECKALLKKRDTEQERAKPPRVKFERPSEHGFPEADFGSAPSVSFTSARSGQPRPSFQSSPRERCEQGHELSLCLNCKQLFCSRCDGFHLSQRGQWLCQGGAHAIM